MDPKLEDGDSIHLQNTNILWWELREVAVYQGDVPHTSIEIHDGVDCY